LNPGERIGPYRIVRRLGEGGIGEVFHAVDETLERDVAIKRLRPELAAREQLVLRFRAEAQTLARLNHPNIATLYALEHSDNSMCMVMEYVEGETIAALLRQRGPLELEPALQLAFQALDGIGYAHARGVIHRDIKGSNLMLDAAGTLKIMDFGIARVLGEQRQTRAGQLVGTPEFMAPEQIRGQDADERSDLYSLAILIFSLLSGRGPFRAHSDYDLMKAQVESPPPSILGELPDVPAQLDEVLGRALAKRPEDRFQSASELRAALEPLADHPTPTGGFDWPMREPREEAETSLLPDTGADPDAPTLGADEVPPATALPLIDAELLDDAAPTGMQEAERGGRFALMPALAVLGFVVGAVLGLDVLETRKAVSAAHDALEATDVRLAPNREPAQSRPEPSRHQQLDRLYGPNQSSPAGPEIRFEVPQEPEDTTSAKEPDETSRSKERAPGPSPATRSGERPTPRAQGEQGWVIRRR
jgi:serine/threonine-protein kinase